MTVYIIVFDGSTEECRTSIYLQGIYTSKEEAFRQKDLIRESCPEVYPTCNIFEMQLDTPLEIVEPGEYSPWNYDYSTDLLLGGDEC